MSVIVREPTGQNRLLVKGAVESVLVRSSHCQLADGCVVPMDEACVQLVLSRHMEMSSKGLRCLGLAYKNDLGELSDHDGEHHPTHKKLLDPTSYISIETDLIFVGVVGLRDPPRAEVKSAIEECGEAGIKVLVPYVGLNFAVYESLKDWLIKSRPFGLVEDTELSVITKLACGVAAGTVGQTVAYPLDVIRRRMQMVGWKDVGSVVKGEGKSAMEYNGMIDAFRKTVRHEGFGALYKVLVPNSVKVVPSIAIAFVSYEVIKDILKVDMRISD